MPPRNSTTATLDRPGQEAPAGPSFPPAKLLPGLDRALPAVAMLGLLLLAGLAGTAWAEFRWFPYPQLLRPSYEAVRAWQHRTRAARSLKHTDLWRPARVAAGGVTIHEPPRCSAGYTLYTSAHTAGATLIDMQGNVVHTWQLPFRHVWPDAPHVRHAMDDSRVIWRRVHLYPNGDLLAIYIAAGDTPWGYGLIKCDRQSRLIWAYADRVHHDLFVQDDGTIFVLAHQLRDTRVHPVPQLPGLRGTVLDDYVVQLSPAGHPLRRVSVLDALSRSPYRDLLRPAPRFSWDPLHINALRVIDSTFAARHAFALPGQVLLSSRETHALALLDMSAEQIVWAVQGPFRRQHDPDPLPNGHILLFDNLGHTGPGGASRVIEWDPGSQAISWIYAGDEQHPLESEVRSVQQLLPGGNLLITESDGARLLEVTREGDIVWEFHNPQRLAEDPSWVPIVCGAIRYRAEDLPFLAWDTKKKEQLP